MEKKSSTFEENMTLLMERFPKLALLAPRWPIGASTLEKLDAVDPGKAEAYYIYGIGQGAPYFQLREWLRESHERKIVFIEDDPSCLGAWIHSEKAKELLCDPQVHLEWIAARNDIQALAERFPLKRIEIVSLPSRKGARFRSLRLRLLRKTALSHALFLDRLHGYQPMQNFICNLRQMPHSFYANRLKDSFRDVPAILCGAGPSLETAIPQLKQLKNRALLIAGGSTMAALSSQGITPHFGMAIDPNLEEYRRFRNSFAFETPLLYSTRVFPGVFQTCNGPFGYMRSGIGGILEIWMEEELGLFDPLIGENLSSESISVTTICAAWAQFLGCNPILFCGVDLAYTGKKHYAKGVDEDIETSFELLDSEKSAADRILVKKDRNGQRVHTAIRWIMESSSLTHFAKKHKEIQFYNTTEGGIGFRGIPFIPLAAAAEKLLTHRFDLAKKVQEEIAKSLMPANTTEIIDRSIQELKQSLDRVINHLEILSDQKKGSKHLAELELQEEIATTLLFYDIEDILERTGSASQSNPSSEEKWIRFLDLARKYQTI